MRVTYVNQSEILPKTSSTVEFPGKLEGWVWLHSELYKMIICEQYAISFKLLIHHVPKWSGTL